MKMQRPPMALWLELVACVFNCSFPHPVPAACWQPTARGQEGGREHQAPWVTPTSSP